MKMCRNGKDSKIMPKGTEPKRPDAHNTQCCAAQIMEELLERNFGELELKPDSNYQRVWDADAATLSSAPAGGGESVIQVVVFFIWPCIVRNSCDQAVQTFIDCCSIVMTYSN